MSRLLLPGILLLAACAAPPPPPQVHIAHLGDEGGDFDRMAAIAEAFAARNPGYAVAWQPWCGGLDAEAEPRVAFVQSGTARVTVRSPGGRELVDEVAVGDLVVLRRHEALVADARLHLLVFTLPSPPAADVPPFVHPDRDPRLSDTPGGCATDAKAYRRLLLTWSADNGPYLCHALNAHRVRIDDSFTHYHPLVGGFDEFYLVQDVRPGARLLTSAATAAIEHPETVTREQAASLLQVTSLRPGDLVFLPRGLVHRGLGGIVAQVVTVPGFVPGAEIGVDRHLRAIDERLGLAGAEALPWHADAPAPPSAGR